MNLAPIVLFVYNRFSHTQECIAALEKNEFAAQSDLVILSDGPKDEKDKEGVLSVRRFIHTVKNFRSVRIFENDKNSGLANSIISGINKVLSEYNRVIVLEDDIVTSSYFLKYMNEALDFYENDERIISVAGYTAPVKIKLPETFFLKGADCWGWGTWKRGWNLFNPDSKELERLLIEKDLMKRFNFYGDGFYSRMLASQIAGKINSWAVRWYASALVHDKFTLYPGRSLVHNIGTDRSGAHCLKVAKWNTNLSASPIRISPIPHEESSEIVESYRKILNRKPLGLWLQKILMPLNR